MKQRLWPIWGSFVLSLAGYGLMVWGMSLRVNWGLLVGLYRFVPTTRQGLGYVALICLLYGVYLHVANLLNQAQWRPTPIHLFLLSLTIALPTIFVYPFNANDIFRYALRGRITAIYQANPYTTPPATFPEDFFTRLAGEWATATTPYGPIWELLAGGVAGLTGHSPYLHILILKLVSLVSFWLIGWLIWYVLQDKKPGERLCYTFLWWGNPALLLTFGVDGHNDSVMLLWLILGWVVWHIGCKRGDFTWLWLGLTIMWLAPLTKAIALLAIPFFAIASWTVLPTWKQRIGLALSTAASYVILSILAFLPFGSVIEFAGRLANEATGGASFSPVALTILAVRDRGGSFDFIQAGQILLGSLSLIALVLGGVTWWYGREPLRSTADLLWVYVLQAFNFRLWYTTWLFPFLLLDVVNHDSADKWHQWRLRFGLAFLLCGQLSVFIYGHVWRLLERDHLQTHMWGVFFTFVLPFLLVWVIKAPAVASDPVR